MGYLDFSKEELANSSVLSAEVLNVRNIRGQTALHCAVRAGDPDSVHYLQSHGSAINVLDNHKNSVRLFMHVESLYRTSRTSFQVIHYLADAYNEAIFKEILEAPSLSETDLDALNEEGFSALHLAVRRCRPLDSTHFCSLLDYWVIKRVVG